MTTQEASRSSDLPESPQRRRLAALLGTSGLLALAGCGGGGSDGAAAPPAPAPAPSPVPTPAPAPPPAPTPAPAVQGISLLAGAIGGSGDLDGFGGDARVRQPTLLAAAPSGAVYFGDGQWVGRVSAQGVLSYIARLPLPTLNVGGLAVDPMGSVFVSATGTGVIYRLFEGVQPEFVVAVGAETGFPSPAFRDGVGTSARLYLPRTLIADSEGGLYILDSGNRAVRKMAADRTVTTLAAGFTDPKGMARLPDGDLLVLDAQQWRRVSPAGVVTTVPGTVPAIVPGALAAADANGVFALLGHGVVRVGLDGSVTTVAGNTAEAGSRDGPGGQSRFNAPAGLTRLAEGDLVVSDSMNAVLRRVVPASGDTVARIGEAPRPGRVDAVGPDARFAAMSAAAVDTAGNVYVVDSEAKLLRKVTPAGVVTTLFQDFPSEGGVAVDAAGNCYGVRDRAIIQVAPDGGQRVFAGQPGVLGFADGPGAQAQFARPRGLAFDAAGNLFVGDGPQVDPAGWFVINDTYTYGDTIRKITPAGEVSTFSGNRGRQLTERDPVSGQFNQPADYLQPGVLAIDAAGAVYVLDTRRANVRRVPPQGGASELLLQASLGSIVRGMAVTAAGEVYLAQDVITAGEGQIGHVVRKLAAGGSSVVVVGQEARHRLGVRLSPLPGTLNFVSALVARADGSLLALSENAVLILRLV